ncbi:required for meiotic nuclear division protein 1 homolog [Styela clava]
MLCLFVTNSSAGLHRIVWGAGQFHMKNSLRSLQKNQVSTLRQIHKCGVLASTETTQKRQNKKKRKRDIEKASGDCLCITNATADKYKMKNLVSEILGDKRLSVKNMSEEFDGAVNIEASDESVIAHAGFSGEMFIFRDGAISFWNINTTIIENILKISKIHAHNSYSSDVVNSESEEMIYSYDDGPSRIQQSKFILSGSSEHKELSLDMFAFSNALCSSVKLAHWEHTLDTLINSLETVPNSLIEGSRVKYETPAKILRKIGEIFLIRHRVNLQYNLLDVPDTYWDHENLEKLYVSTTRYLNINRRVHLMNEKLTYCAHMAELLKTDLHEKRSLRVEILIVLLIFIEIVFEVLHLFVLPLLKTSENDSSGLEEDE